MYASPTGVRQLVHGSFMTKAAWRLKTASGHELFMAVNAMAPGAERRANAISEQRASEESASEQRMSNRWEQRGRKRG